MPVSYPGDELSVEQLVHALAQALGPASSSGRKQLFESGLQKISVMERDLHEALRVTREIMNMFIPINQLPPEILSNVLEHRTSDRDLVAATHVCQCWRSTLTSSPSLWTCFLFSGPNNDVDRTLTYLKRSRSAPIDIRVDLKSKRGPEVFEHLAHHIARTRSLIIQGLQDTEVHAACLLLRTPSPTLQHLEVCAKSGFVRLPDDFLGRQAPSLHSITFNGVHPAFESHFPLPNLTELKLSLPEGTGPFHVDALFRFLSGCPWLRKVYIKSTEVSQDMALDQIVSLESLEELDYTCSSVGRILPCLRLPLLERLRVTSSLGQAQKLADLLPHGGHALLAGATEILYDSQPRSQMIGFCGRGTDVSFTVFRPTTSHAPVDWFPDDTCIPFGQIEELTVGVSVAVDFPINISTFENIRALRIIPRNMSFVERFLGSLYPYPGAGVPCRSLQEIEYPLWGCLRPLINLTRERNRAGHQLELVCLLTDMWYGFDQDLVEELEEHVGEIRIKDSWDDF